MYEAWIVCQVMSFVAQLLLIVILWKLSLKVEFIEEEKTETVYESIHQNQAKSSSFLTYMTPDELKRQSNRTENENLMVETDRSSARTIEEGTEDAEEDLFNSAIKRETFQKQQKTS